MSAIISRLVVLAVVLIALWFLGGTFMAAAALAIGFAAWWLWQILRPPELAKDPRADALAQVRVEKVRAKRDIDRLSRQYFRGRYAQWRQEVG